MSGEFCLNFGAPEYSIAYSLNLKYAIQLKANDENVGKVISISGSI